MPNININRDIMDWEEFPDYDVLWTDPPWENRMVKFFETQLHKDTGRQRPGHTLHELLGQLGRLASRNRPLVVESGGKVAALRAVIARLKEFGHIPIHNITALQKNGRKQFVSTFNVHVPVPFKTKMPDTITQTLLKLKVCDSCHKPGSDGLNCPHCGRQTTASTGTIFDPFGGIGFTARAVRKAGWSYIGSELNPDRYKKLVAANPED